MPVADFGTVRVFVGVDRVDVTFPRGFDGLMTTLKDMKGRWNPERRCWSVTPLYAKLDPASIVDRIRNSLMSTAPPGWDEAVKRFGPFACTTKKYEVKVGEGGVRIGMPDGHPSHWALKQVEGGKREGTTWLLPATSISASLLRGVLERIVREDKEFFVSCVEHLEGRIIKGFVPGSPEEADGLGLVAGGVAYADHSFLKIADPQVLNSPIHAWPFKVGGRVEREDGFDVGLGYPPPEWAYKAVRFRMGRQPEDRTALLDLVHATEKWQYKQT
jgi:hypothetical protein